MKKLFVFVMLLFLLCLTTKVEASENYDTFQEVELSGGKLLEDYTESDYSSYYQSVDQRRFWGWRSNVVNRNIKAKFVSETVFSYYNNGSTPIVYKYQLSQSVVEKFSISATGSIKYTLNGEIKKFKNNLDAETKVNLNYDVTTTTKEEEVLEIKIDPMTVANLKIVGEARVTNGVAAYYIFWIRTQRGGFEYFVVTTQYPRLEVLPI